MSNRIELSAGTIAARSVPDAKAYEEGAIVPLAPWRLPSNQELSLLESDEPTSDSGSTVSVVTVPNSILRPFSGFTKAAECGGHYQIERLLSEKGLHERVEVFAKKLFKRMSVPARQEIAGGIISHACGQTTVTEQPDTRRRVGLHLDNWYEFPIHRRSRSPNRICINLGAQERFFLYLNIPVAGLYRRLRGKDKLGSNTRGTLIARVFFNLFPAYPIIRVRVRPGEAYIAPTENIIHDGSTSEMTVPDVNLSLRGYLPLVFEK